MGLDAWVRCRCWEEGKVKPSPFPEHTRLNLEEEAYFELDFPYKSNKDKYALFDKWTQECCEHGDLHYARERISNWGGYRLFQEALGQAGWEHFPVLKAELPEHNGGSTAPEAAALALQELDYFEGDARLGSVAVLVDTDSGFVIFEYIRGYDGVFIMSGRSGLEAGVDPQGFFLREGNPPSRELFRARRFEQRLLGARPLVGYDGDVEYIDTEGGQRFVGRLTVTGQEIAWPDGRMEDDRGRSRFEYPVRLHVEERQRSAADFAYIVEPLRAVFQAAVTVGNPVYWT